MGKSYVESSLKRFLKRKVKITMGFVVTFMISGNFVFAGVVTDPINKDTDLYQVTIKDDVNINTTFPIGIQLNSENIQNNYHDLKIENNDINIKLNSNSDEARGLSIANGSKLFLGKKDTKKIEINVKNTNLAVGISNIGHVNNQNLGAETTVNGKNLNITVSSTKNAAFGIIAQNNTNIPLNQIDVKKVAKIKINSENTTINVNTINSNALGILCFSNSQIDVTGNLTVNAKSEKDRKSVV